jgi:hypothetical protein
MTPTLGPVIAQTTDTAIPADLAGGVVLVVSLLLTAAWLLYLYR